MLLVLPLRSSSFWSLALHTLGGTALQSLYQDKVASNLEKLTLEAFFLLSLKRGLHLGLHHKYGWFFEQICWVQSDQKVISISKSSAKTGSLREPARQLVEPKLETPVGLITSELLEAMLDRHKSWQQLGDDVHMSLGWWNKLGCRES